MRFAINVVISALAAGTCLGGCVAAVVPLVAGGVIAQKGLRKDDRPKTASDNPAPPPGSPPATAIAGGKPADAELAGSPYGPFVEHALHFAGQPKITDIGASTLLADPSSLKMDRTPCRSHPPAVLIDLDPAGGLMPLVPDIQSSDAVLGGALARMRDEGITVIWISGHEPESAGRIRDILADAWLDPYGTDPLVLMRFAGESKQERRRGLGESYCLVAIAGDQRADFDDLYEYVLDPAMAAPLDAMIGNGWFLAPPPIG